MKERRKNCHIKKQDTTKKYKTTIVYFIRRHKYLYFEYLKRNLHIYFLFFISPLTFAPKSFYTNNNFYIFKCFSARWLRFENWLSQKGRQLWCLRWRWQLLFTNPLSMGDSTNGTVFGIMWGW